MSKTGKPVADGEDPNRSPLFPPTVLDAVGGIIGGLALAPAVTTPIAIATLGGVRDPQTQANWAVGIGISLAILFAVVWTWLGIVMRSESSLRASAEGIRTFLLIGFVIGGLFTACLWALEIGLTRAFSH
jgi:hypothetical protein